MLFIMYLLIFGCFDLLSSENRKEEIIFDGDTIVVTQSDATEKCFYYKYHDYFKVCERKALCFDIKNFFYLSRPLRQILDFKNNKELSERSLLEIFESFQQHIVGPSANHLASKIEFVLTLDNFKGNDKEDLLRQGVVYLEIIVEDFLCACLKDNLLFYVQTDRGFALSNDTQELLQGMIKQKIDKSFEKIIENKDFSLEECDKKKTNC